MVANEGGRSVWMRCGYVLCLVAQSCPTVCDPTDCSLPVHGGLHVVLCPCGFSRQEHWSGLPCPPPGDLPNLGFKPRFPTLQAESFTDWATREAEEYWSVSLSLVQRIFPTQELKWGFLHCGRILYQLSYQGSPKTLQLAENGFDPLTSGLWAQHASAAPLC